MTAGSVDRGWLRSGGRDGDVDGCVCVWGGGGGGSTAGGAGEGVGGGEEEATLIVIPNAGFILSKRPPTRALCCWYVQCRA